MLNLLGSGAWASSGPGAGEKGLESGHGEVDIMKVIEISSPFSVPNGLTPQGPLHSLLRS